MDGEIGQLEALAGDATGLPVAPGLVPAVEQPAPRRPAPLWQSVPVALLAFALLASIAFAAVWANDRWGDAAQVATAADAFRALVSGDADGFLALVEPDVRAGVKRADITRNADLGRTLTWSPPVFAGGAERLEARQAGQGRTGVATFSPDPSRGDLVRMRASGPPFGEASGTVQLVRTVEGWRIIGFRFEGLGGPSSGGGG